LIRREGGFHVSRDISFCAWDWQRANRRDALTSGWPPLGVGDREDPNFIERFRYGARTF
jgi:hypothetical protein